MTPVTLVTRIKRFAYRILFSNGLAYRSPRWYALADWLVKP